MIFNFCLRFYFWWNYFLWEFSFKIVLGFIDYKMVRDLYCLLGFIGCIGFKLGFVLVCWLEFGGWGVGMSSLNLDGVYGRFILNVLGFLN